MALLFPIDWPEPFGLVMIEAMAAGTPVIAFPFGSVPEVIDDGVTGVVVPGIEEAAAAIERVRSFDRRGIRAVFEKRFSAEVMARKYLNLYRRGALRPQARRPAAAVPAAPAAPRLGVLPEIAAQPER
jgi:glycosyltransferase involved in cell wall biosynthesis